jgi:hypothetical protein
MSSLSASAAILEFTIKRNNINIGFFADGGSV